MNLALLGSEKPGFGGQEYLPKNGVLAAKGVKAPNFHSQLFFCHNPLSEISETRLTAKISSKEVNQKEARWREKIKKQAPVPEEKSYLKETAKEA